MPEVVNGCGTWYYGKKNLQHYQGVCRSCGATTTLTSYDTRLYVVVVFVPIIPLGRKRIIEQCAACTRHVAMPLDEWRSAERRLSDAVAAYRAAPQDPERAKEAVGACAGFRNLPAFLDVAPDIERNLSGHAETLRLLAAVHDVFGRAGDAERVLRVAMEAEADDDENATREALADVLLRQGRPEDAEPLLGHVVEQGIPDRVDALYQLAQGYQLKGNHEKALEAFTQCEVVSPMIVKDATFTRLRDESRRRLGTQVPVQPGKVVSRANRAASFRKAMKVAPVVLLLVAVAYGALSYVQGRRRSVYLLNGLHKVYSVRVNGEVHELAPRDVKLVRVPEGDVTVEIVDPATPVPAETVSLKTSFLSRPFSGAMFVLNPDRGAVLVKSRVYYHSSYSGSSGREADVSYATGKLLHRFDGIEYPFEDHPTTIKMSSSNKEEERDGVTIVKTDEVPEPTVLLASMDELGPEAVAEAARRHLLLEPERDEYLTVLAVTMTPEALVEFMRPGLDRRPVLMNWHRLYQDVVSDEERDARMEREYLALLEKEGRDGDIIYLAGRATRDRGRALELIRRSATAEKPCAYAHFALCSEHLANAEFSEAAANARKALRALPEGPGVRAYAKLALLADGDYDKFFELCREDQSGSLMKAVEAAQEEIAVRTAVAYTLRGVEQQRHLDEAVRVENELRRRLSGYSHDPDAHEREIAALKAYGAGSRQNYVEIMRASPSPADQLCAHLTHGAAAEAEAALAQTRPHVRWHLMIHLVAARTGNAEVAARQLKATAELLAKGNGEEREFGRALEGKSKLGRSELLQLRHSPVDKALLLAALGVADPGGRAEYFALAKALNFDRRFPYLLIDDVLKHPPGGGK